MANPQIENGHLDLANELVEVLAKTQLSGYESRILWVVWRRTYCWHKKEERIKFDYFREATGLLDSNISKTIKRLIGRNILIKNDNKYSFQKDYQKWQVKLSKMISPLIENDNKTYQKIPSTSTTKESIKRNLLKESIKRKGSIEPIDNRNTELQDVMDFSKSKNFSLQGSEKINRQYAYNLIRKKDATNNALGVERVKWLIEVAISVRGQPYAPQVNDFKSLFYKWQDLINFKQKGQNEQRSKKPTIG